MNGKIQEIIKYCAVKPARLYGFFGSDEWGSWSFSQWGNDTVWANSNGLYAHGYNQGNFVIHNSGSSLSRTIPNICKAREISFSFSVSSSGWNQANQTSWSFNALNAVSYSYGNNGGNGTYNIVMKQNGYTLNGKSYSYSGNKKLREFDNNTISASIRTGFVGSANMWVDKRFAPVSSNMTVKW